MKSHDIIWTCTKGNWVICARNLSFGTITNFLSRRNYTTSLKSRTVVHFSFSRALMKTSTAWGKKDGWSDPQRAAFVRYSNFTLIPITIKMTHLTRHAPLLPFSQAENHSPQTPTQWDFPLCLCNQTPSHQDGPEGIPAPTKPDILVCDPRIQADNVGLKYCNICETVPS